jgi:hypothetical protein
MTDHINRVFKAMNVEVDREACILSEKLRVDFCFRKPRNKKRLKSDIPVVMEVDGPYHYLLELPSTPGEQLPPDERDLNTTIRKGVRESGKAWYEEMQQMFTENGWGAPLHFFITTRTRFVLKESDRECRTSRNLAFTTGQKPLIAPPRPAEMEPQRLSLWGSPW